MNDITLRPDEQKVYDQLVKSCSKPLAKIPHSLQNTCVILKKQLELDAAQKKAEAEAIARAKLSYARLQAVLYVIDKVSTRQAEATMLLGALLQASSAYDQILAARAAKPFLTELILGVGVAFIPELKVLGRIASRCVPNATSTLAMRALSKAKTSSLPDWEALAEHVLAKSKKVDRGVIRFAQALDNQSGSAIQAVRSPLIQFRRRCRHKSKTCGVCC